MNTIDFMEATISHQLKDPHSKALEPDCLSPPVSNYGTASQWGRGDGGIGRLRRCNQVAGGQKPGRAFVLAHTFEVCCQVYL